MWGVFLVLINLLGYGFMGIDKKRAILGKWRISEKALLTCAFCFGSFGVYVGMQHFRHKTKHWSFKLIIPLLMLLQSAAMIYYFMIY